jgi:nucleotide-binding universal stress UspA family protein
MFRSILVPLDGSNFAEQALPVAAELARTSGATLHLAEVSHQTVIGNEFGAVAVVDTRPVETVRAYLAEVTQRLTGPFRTPPVADVLRGPTIETLTKYVDHSKIDLIVMTTHGRGPIARAWLGSVADELTRSVKVPLLLLRPKEGGHVPGSATGFGHVLVALDGTPEAEAMIEPALELAKLSRADVTLVRILEMLPSSGLELAMYGIPSPDPELLAEIRADVRNYLEGRAKAFAGRGVRVQTDLVEHTHIASGILEDAKRRGCDLIVLATHGYGALARMLLGSVTDKVIRSAETAVLVCHTMPAKAPDKKTASSGDTAMDRDELTTVFTTGDPNLARMVANELKSEGINATVSGENQAGLSGILDVEVLVRAWDADRARTIIEEGGHHDKPEHGPDRGQKPAPPDQGAHGPHGKHPKIT